MEGDFMARQVRGTAARNRAVSGGRPAGGGAVNRYNNTPYAVDPAYAEPEALPRPRPQPAPQPQRAPERDRKRERKHRHDPVYEREHRPWLKVSFSAIITTLLFFGGAGAYLVSAAMCSVHLSYGQGLQADLRSLNESNMAISSSITQSYDLEHVRDVAINKLHMVVPDEHQKIYITVPNDNYFVQY